jgi:hypothetical protein
MAKPTPAQMKAAVEAFKKKFTTGFYHGSPSPSIKSFNPEKSKKDFPIEGVTFVSPNADFASSFAPNKKGATMYPVNVNMGKHFDPFAENSLEVLESYFQKQHPNLSQSSVKETAETFLEDLRDPVNNWNKLERASLLQHLKDTGHDTFAVNEGGISNVGVFKPQNIRGKFAAYDPTEAANPDFMKAKGGKVAKRALEFAKSVPFVHYSKAPNISTLDPNMYGTGIKGREAARLKDAPDIKPRSYFYTQAGGRQPEQGLGPHKYQGVAEDIYPLHDDPAGFSQIAKVKAIDPYMMSQGIERIDEQVHLNELERLIKKAGYKGYANDDVGLLFDPTPVMKAD